MDAVMTQAKNMKIRLFVMMALQMGIWGCWAAKLFPFMGLLGFSATQQALVGSSWGIASIVGIFFSNQFADRTFAAGPFLAASHLISGFCLLGAAFTTSFAGFFALYLLYSLVYVPTISVSNTLAFANLTDPGRDFGKVRMGGTAGWVIASWPMIFLLGAQSTATDVRWIFIVAALMSFALSAYALTLPATPPARAEAADPLAWRRAFAMLRHPAIAVLFIVTFIDSVVHNGYFVLSDIFLTNRVGIAGNLSMVVLSLGQVAELLTMLVLGSVLARLGWRVTMMIGILGHAIRFLVFAFAADSVAAIVAVQLVHGICYAFFFATVYIYVDDAFPKDVRVSAQGMFNLLILGIGMVVASFLFPSLAEHFSSVPQGSTDGSAVVDYQKLFLVPSGLALLGVVLLGLFFRPISPFPSGGQTDENEAPAGREVPA